MTIAAPDPLTRLALPEKILLLVKSYPYLPQRLAEMIEQMERNHNPHNPAP